MRHIEFRIAAILGMIAIAIHLLPPDYSNAARNIVRDAAAPGLATARWGIARTKAAWESRPTDVITRNAAASPNVSNQVEQWKQRARRLRLQNAKLQGRLDEQAREGISPYPVTSSNPLVQPRLLDARVLGVENTRLWQAGQMIDVGSKRGVGKKALVVQAEPLIDLGRNSKMDDGLPVYAGRTVIGRIVETGRWTSTVQLVTSSKYRGLARLVRKGKQGYTFGAKGILEGQGEKPCRLKFVASNRAVSVGDELYTADHELAHPFYYGRVIAARLPPGAPHWEILIEPALRQLDKLQHVQVLRKDIRVAPSLAN
jgi:cell shape-determining protein MreC